LEFFMNTVPPLAPAWGIDIGRSSVKIVGPDGPLLLLPSAVAPAIPIDDPAEAARAAKDTVEVRGAPWFFGQTAVVQANAEPGLSPGFQHSIEYEVLVAGACTRVASSRAVSVVAGLPSEASAADRELVVDIFKDYLPAGSKISVVHQPAGVFFDEARRDPSIAQGNAIIVDVGRYSTDLAAVREGRPVQTAWQSLPGVRFAVDRLRESLRGVVQGSPAFARLELALLTGEISYNAQKTDVAGEVAAARDALSAEVNRGVQALLAQLRGEVDVIVLAGGGADLITVPNARRSTSGRMAVASGFAYLARQQLNRKVGATE
jgi:hypothetical protein